jgi:hypothetical protein
VEKVSDHGTISPRTFFEFPENISPGKKNCNNLDKKEKFGEKFTPCMASEMQLYVQ